MPKRRCFLGLIRHAPTSHSAPESPAPASGTMSRSKTADANVTEGFETLRIGNATDIVQDFSSNLGGPLACHPEYLRARDRPPQRQLPHPMMLRAAWCTGRSSRAQLTPTVADYRGTICHPSRRTVRSSAPMASIRKWRSTPVDCLTDVPSLMECIDCHQCSRGSVRPSPPPAISPE